jgi:hypothetical protein
MALGATLEVDRTGLEHLAASADVPDPSRLAFFDIETTGLSGGTGTFVIIAGLGSYEAQGAGEPRAFRMRQYFLADVAHERAMLTMLEADVARFDGLVTYNGRAFDVPFVETRMTLARLRPRWSTLPHVDLLHAVRRLYRHRMPGCRLAEAERRLLHIERHDDVPGALIPALYFDYLRAGRVAPLRAVMRHNADDVLSLAGVMAALAGLLSRDDLDPDDAVAVARWWELAGERARAAALYRGALPWLEGSDDWPWAAARHAALCKRARSRDEAAALWRALWDAGDRAAGLELAKHLEHHARDLRTAEAVTGALFAGAGGADGVALAHRLARIRRKLGRVQ